MLETPQGVVRKPAQPRPSLVKSKLGLLVYPGELPPGFDAVRASMKTAKTASASWLI